MIWVLKLAQKGENMTNNEKIKYIEGKSRDLKERQDSVRKIIGDKHWGEDGHYKELILRDWLKSEIDSINKEKALNVKIGTGFVTNGDKCSSQIDLIVYNESAVLCSEHTLYNADLRDELVIVNKEAVLAIIEVKTRIAPSKSKSIVNKLISNKMLIGKHIFAGIFAYECQAKGKKLSDESLKSLLLNSKENFKTILEKSLQYEMDLCPIDCIALDENYFVKFWNAGLPQDSYRNNHYSFYSLINRSFGYFILNIKERILLTLCSRNEFSVKDQNGIYLDGGKEGFKILDCNEVNGWCGKRDSIFADFGAESERDY